MLTRRIRIQVLAFVVLSVLATSFLGARYVGVGHWWGDDGYRVTVRLPDTGGTFTNGEVTYRGVPVGRIGDLRLSRGGVEIVLDIDPGAPPIPADLDVRVANRSAIGEQYIDLRPRSEAGPFLDAGDVITGTAADLPPDVEEVLESSRSFAESVPLDDLRTVVDESYEAFQGSGDDLRRLLATSSDFIGTADRNLLTTSSLIDNADTVLATQQESASDIRSFSADLRALAGTLKSSDPELRRLFATTPRAARQIDALFRQVGQPLGVLLANLVTPAQIFGTQAAQVQDLLTNAPRAIGIGYAVNGAQGIRLSLGTTFFTARPCTAGYGGTTVRPGTDTSPGQAFNASAGCDTSTDTGGGDVRGPVSAPGTPVPNAVTETAPARSITVPTTLADLMGGR